MKNTFGSHITLTLFGESHGPAVGAVLDGLAPGIPVDEGAIARLLDRRRPRGAGETARREADAFRIESGVFGGHTTGTPLCLLIPNADTHSADYTYGPVRPSHADYAASEKYHRFEDYRGGGHFSGRLTAALVAAGGILLPALRQKGIRVGAHILACGGVYDRAFSPLSPEEEIDGLSDVGAAMPVLDAAQGAEMEKAVLAAAADRDSVGGIVECAVTGLPAGLGEPWFESVEGQLAAALFAVGGIKGVAFGAGFALCDRRGSDANDPFRMAPDGRVRTTKNDSGGLNGGLTNGMPVLFSCAVRPTPSVAKVQKTVDITTGQDVDFAVRGRHDPAIVRRVCPVVESVAALVMADLLAGRYGTDWLREADK